MSRRPLGAPREAGTDFPLDRPMGAFFLALFAARLVLTAWAIGAGWPRAAGAPLTDYLAGRWWVHARYLAESAATFYTGVGLLRGRRWGMVGLAFLYLVWLVGSVAGLAKYGPNAFEIAYLVPESLVLAYVGMRLTGSLGPKPRHPAPVRISLSDRIGAGVGFLLLGFSVVLVVVSNVRGFHRTQDMGAIEPLPYLASRWVAHTQWD